MPITIKFKPKKQTPGTYVYEEVPENGQPPKVKTLYIQKWALPNPPQTLTVTIA